VAIKEKKVRAVIYYLHPDNRILFCIATRAAGTMAGSKECLGGGIAARETPVAACRRELKEETGFPEKVILKHLYPKTMCVNFFQEKEWELHIFLLKAGPVFYRAVENFTPTAEVSALEWMEVSQFETLLTPYQQESVLPIIKDWYTQLQLYLPKV